MTAWMKRALIGSPLEGIARRLYLRLDPSWGGRHDRETLEILKRRLSRNSNCVDIGAFRGAILREIVTLAPLGTHYAFEPLPEHCRYLEKVFPLVRVYPLALSNNKGRALFTHVLGRPTRSGFCTLTSPGERTVEIEVQTDQLDSVLPPDLPIQFIKLDVEGAEDRVLQGRSERSAAGNPG